LSLINPNLIGHWKLDEGAGIVAYDSASDNDGNLMGDPNWVTGKIGSYALSFDGDGDYINVGNDLSLKPPLPVTLAAWIKLSMVNKDQHIINLDKLPSVHTGIWFAVRDTNELVATYGDGGGGNPSDRRTKNGTTALDVDTWYHVAAVIKGPTDMDIYINGVDDGGTYSGSGGSLYYTANNDSFIGSYGGFSHFFDGIIDDVRVYDRALFPEEVKELYYEGLSYSERAIIELKDAINEKTAALVNISEALTYEYTAFGFLEESLLEKDYGGLSKQDIAGARRAIRSEIRKQQHCLDTLADSIDALEETLITLGWQPDPNQAP